MYFSPLNLRLFFYVNVYKYNFLLILVVAQIINNFKTFICYSFETIKCLSITKNKPKINLELATCFKN